MNSQLFFIELGKYPWPWIYRNIYMVDNCQLGFTKLWSNLFLLGFWLGLFLITGWIHLWEREREPWTLLLLLSIQTRHLMLDELCWWKHSLTHATLCLTPNFPSPWKGCFNALNSMLVVEFSLSFEVKMGLFLGSWYMGDELWRGGEMGTNNISYFKITIIEGSNAQENPMFYPLKKNLWHIKFTWKRSGRLVWFTRWEQLNNWASPWILMSKCAIHSRLATLHLM